jgi:DNA-binding NtrC family response regulator
MRVLFMSGLHRGRGAAPWRVDEALAFIAKPFTPDALAAAVRDVLDAGRARPCWRRPAPAAISFGA